VIDRSIDVPSNAKIKHYLKINNTPMYPGNRSIDRWIACIHWSVVYLEIMFDLHHSYFVTGGLALDGTSAIWTYLPLALTVVRFTITLRWRMSPVHPGQGEFDKLLNKTLILSATHCHSIC